MTKEEELEVIKNFIKDGGYSVEYLGDGWDEYPSYSDTPEDLHEILKQGDEYRLVKTLTIWDFGID